MILIAPSNKFFIKALSVYLFIKLAPKVGIIKKRTVANINEIIKEKPVVMLSALSLNFSFIYLSNLVSSPSSS